ncbi:hypothetical protein K474DRAFT_1666439 [Panus rudis PR-1116 ss-1]|nr:hypothetical protein K474DRAFT_1666439 [Panus rudis PR-1116 ss-1]
MSLARALLTCVQATCYQLASTPPNKTPSKARFDHNHPWYIRIAPMVFKVQQPLVWLCTFADIALILAQRAFSFTPPVSNVLTSTICPRPTTTPVHSATSTPSIYAAPLFFLGVLFVIFGTLLRLACYRTLGSFFTFDLTIMPSHKLVTAGPYGIVRHPAYTGSLFAILGLSLVNLTQGGWVVECDILGRGAYGLVARVVLFMALYGWWLAVGVHRARAEDQELKKIFGKEWDAYAAAVPWWFVPGVL